jgi:hypothetical protein
MNEKIAKAVIYWSALMLRSVINIFITNAGCVYHWMNTKIPSHLLPALRSQHLAHAMQLLPGIERRNLAQPASIHVTPHTSSVDTAVTKVHP